MGLRPRAKFSCPDFTVLMRIKFSSPAYLIFEFVDRCCLSRIIKQPLILSFFLFFSYRQIKVVDQQHHQDAHDLIPILWLLAAAIQLDLKIKQPALYILYICISTCTLLYHRGSFCMYAAPTHHTSFSAFFSVCPLLPLPTCMPIPSHHFHNHTACMHYVYAAITLSSIRDNGRNFG
ncbi:hypothetical protein NPIL_137841 [Nephila pilipes]|uniref:Uncharacterized protein n=1 Tax=Nephila pilipes TaxID=299642 RepID=A0A8X6NPX0_NEPPI|nr:hypothetical protein NPIL_137841 [Nephila pilipes]